MNDIARIINIYWRKLLKPLVKYTVIFLVVAAGGFAATQGLILPVLTKDSKDPNKVAIRKNNEGQSYTVFGKDKTPKTFAEEMDVPGQQLIYQNQQRYYQATDPDNEDIANGPVVQVAERKRLEKITVRFLNRWERYQSGQTLANYTESLGSVVMPSAINDIATRIDNRQPAAIGIDGVTGSVPYRPSMYAPNLQLLRYDGETAYATLTAPVTYTGPSQIWAGRSFNRTYGLVFQRFGNEWRVARVAAQTLGEVQHYTPSDDVPSPYDN